MAPTMIARLARNAVRHRNGRHSAPSDVAASSTGAVRANTGPDG